MDEGTAYSITLSDLKVATNNFSKKIGKGSFGSVYYGKMKDGKEIIKKYTLINEGADFPASKTITFTNSQLPEKDLVPLKFHYKESPTINWLPNKLLN